MRRSPRLVGTVALLVLALVVCAALTYQAWDAARSQRAMAERTLQDYAKIADWQLTQQAKNALLGQVVTSLITQAVAASARLAAATGIAPSKSSDIARDMMNGLVQLPRQASSTSSDTTGRRDLPHHGHRRSPTPISRWVRDTMVAYAKHGAHVRQSRRRPLRIARRSFGSFTSSAVILTNDSYAMLFGERNKPLAARRVRRGARIDARSAGRAVRLRHRSQTVSRVRCSPACAASTGAPARCFPNR